MRRQSDWRMRDNPLHLDLFERSSQSLSSSASSSTLDMALNDEGNVRRRLSDYARPVLQRPVTRIHAPLARNANFRIDSHLMSMLPIFHGNGWDRIFRWTFRHLTIVGWRSNGWSSRCDASLKYVDWARPSICDRTITNLRHRFTKQHIITTVDRDESVRSNGCAQIHFFKYSSLRCKNSPVEFWEIWTV